MKRKLSIDASDAGTGYCPTPTPKRARVDDTLDSPRVTDFPSSINVAGIDIPLYRYNEDLGKRRRGFGTFIIHHVSTLDQLIAQVSPFAKDDNVTLRYFMGPDMRFLFAPDGAPKSETSSEKHPLLPPYPIPGHAQMTGKQSLHQAACVCAGDITFSLRQMKVIKINNGSGDFLPDPNSLHLAIFALLSCGVPFAEQLEVSVKWLKEAQVLFGLTENQDHLIWDVARLTEMLMTRFSEELWIHCQESNTPHEPKVAVYLSSDRKPSFFTGEDRDQNSPFRTRRASQDAPRDESSNSNARKKLTF